MCQVSKFAMFMAPSHRHNCSKYSWHFHVPKWMCRYCYLERCGCECGCGGNQKEGLRWIRYALILVGCWTTNWEILELSGNTLLVAKFASICQYITLHAQLRAGRQTDPKRLTNPIWVTVSKFEKKMGNDFETSMTPRTWKIWRMKKGIQLKKLSYLWSLVLLQVNQSRSPSLKLTVSKILTIKKRILLFNFISILLI